MVQNIIFFTFTMFYWLTIIIVIFLSRATFPTIRFTSKLIWEVFYECLLFIYLFNHIKYYYVHVFFFFRNTYSTKLIFNSTTAAITPVYTNNKWIVIKLINVQINKFWPDHTLLIMDAHFVANDLPKDTWTISRTISDWLMNLSLYTILFFFFINYLWIF